MKCRPVFVVQKGGTVSFDPKINTITLRDDADLSADSGSSFMRDLALAPNAAESLVRVWKVIEAWLRTRRLSPL